MPRHAPPLPRDVGCRSHQCCMADIEIRELRAYEPICLECGETGPIETSARWAAEWEAAHSCAVEAELVIEYAVAS